MIQRARSEGDPDFVSNESAETTGSEQLRRDAYLYGGRGWRLASGLRHGFLERRGAPYSRFRQNRPRVFSWQQCLRAIDMPDGFGEVIPRISC